MGDRIIDLSEHACRLSVRYSNLIIEREDEPAVPIPFSDMAVLVVSNVQVRYSHAVLTGITEGGGAFVACNAKHLPVGMLLPLDAHYIQAERFRVQANAKKPTCKQLWKRVVIAKVRAQGSLLQALHGSQFGLERLAGKVRSGDPENIEAQASRRYWPALFGDPGFRRDRQAEDLNRHLNYGYAVLRAIVARALCAAGLHPSLGIHHHNRYNAFCLADDLMEPFRPLVDRKVVEIAQTRGTDAPMDGEAKRTLIGALLGRFLVEGEARTLFDLLSRLAKRLSHAYSEGVEGWSVPHLSPLPEAA